MTLEKTKGGRRASGGVPTSNRSKRPNASSIKEALRSGDEVASVRIQLTLRPEFARRLDELRRSTRTETYADMLRETVSFYEQVHKAAARGARVFVEEADGTRLFLMIR